MLLGEATSLSRLKAVVWILEEHGYTVDVRQQEFEVPWSISQSRTSPSFVTTNSTVATLGCNNLSSNHPNSTDIILLSNQSNSEVVDLSSNQPNCIAIELGSNHSNCCGVDGSTLASSMVQVNDSSISSIGHNQDTTVHGNCSSHHCENNNHVRNDSRASASSSYLHFTPREACLFYVYAKRQT